MDEQFTRRKFIEKAMQNVLGGGMAFLFGSSLLLGCQEDSKSSSEEDPLDVASCDDLSKVSNSEQKKRKGLGYVEESPMPDKQCENCNLYIPPEEGKACGECILFEGPVFAEAYCTYWAPKEEG